MPLIIVIQKFPYGNNFFAPASKMSMLENSLCSWHFPESKEDAESGQGRPTIYENRGSIIVGRKILCWDYSTWEHSLTLVLSLVAGLLPW
jgi:hypothetical protein